MVSLRDDDGNHFRERSTPVAKLKAAYRKIIAQPNGGVNSEAAEPVISGTTVQDVCIAYLNKVGSDGDTATWKDRSDTHIDLCLGFSSGMCDKNTFALKKFKAIGERIEGGFDPSRSSLLDVDNQ